MNRKTWDSIKVGDTIIAGGVTFKVAQVDDYYRSAADLNDDKKTVVRIENERHESMMWGHYLLSGAILFEVNR